MDADIERELRQMVDEANTSLARVKKNVEYVSGLGETLCRFESNQYDRGIIDMMELHDNTRFTPEVKSAIIAGLKARFEEAMKILREEK